MSFGCQNSHVLSSTVLLTMLVHCIVGSRTSAESVRFRLDTTTLEGKVIDAIEVGEPFVLNTYVQELSPDEAEGVFAAYIDLAFDPLASVAGSLEYGPTYQNGKHGELLAGFLNDVGGFSSSDGEGRGGTNPLGPDELLVFSLEMEATTAGEMSFVSSFADNSPVYDVLLYGSNAPVQVSDIEFGTYTLTISEAVPEPSGSLLGLLAVCAGVWLRRR